MVFRSLLLSINIALCLLSLHNANAFKLPKPKPRLVGFSWQDCGPATDPVHVKSLSVGPDPVKVPGNVSVSAFFTISGDTQTDMSLSLMIEKKISGFWIRVPCVDNVGSCTYGDICKTWAEICPIYYAKYGLPCTCPFPTQTYLVTDLVYDFVPKFPAFASGELRINATLVSPTAGHILCLKLDLILAN